MRPLPYWLYKWLPKILIGVGLIFCALSTMIADAQESEQTGTAGQTEQAQPKQPEPSGKSASNKSASKPASTFKPSETIRAETTVSFPADI